MELQQFNDILDLLERDKGTGKARDHIISLAFRLVEWMGFSIVETGIPRLLDFQTLKLKGELVPAPITGQEQLYRLTAEGQNIRIRFAVLKKFDRKTIHYLVENNVGLTSYQASMRGIKQIEGREPYVAQQPYFLHFIATAKYDRLWVVFNDGEQKRVLAFRKRLTQTQHNKVLPLWKDISQKSKPEMAGLFWSSLDVKEVNREFYKHIKEQFDALVGIVKTQIGDQEEEVVKQFAVRLIGRYIFCWFLKEKEIIPEELISSKTIEKNKEVFFQKYLKKLFFNTLNAEVTDPLRNEEITPIDILYKNIPYLNGGLFDWHPEDILFEKTDLNAWLIVFVQVLESFDFTVDESNSQYQQVAIDPEMLGRIFENLLASQNPETEKMANQRKAFGAFYTPREIVDYMVNESLKAYIESKILPELPPEDNVLHEPLVEYKGTLFQAIEPRQTQISFEINTSQDVQRKWDRLKPKIDKLFLPDCSENPFDKAETIIIRNALRDITVLDPACGSGAFPMGVMLRLMELRQIVGHGHRNSYDLKEEILSKNIFGVDIMPMAVEIARLRAWLSLVLESDYKPYDRKNNFGIAALPNLDFKFVCANSLIDSGYDDFQTTFNKTDKGGKIGQFNDEILKLETLRQQYFDPKGDKAKKEELQNAFFKTKETIKTQFAGFKESWNLEEFFNKVDDWNPFEDSKPSSFFSSSWMFGIKDGFDVVIGNPPYIQLQKDNGKLSSLLANKGYATFERTGDLYAIFYEFGFKVLKKRGIHCFITSSQWLKANYGKSLRRLFLSRNPLKLIQLGPGVFESAVVDTNILLAINEFNTNKLVGSIVAKPEQLINLNLLPLSPMHYVSLENWSILDVVKQSINHKISSKCTPLKEWEIKINFGIKTGLNEAFIIDEETKHQIIKADPSSSEIIKPILRGREIEKYYTKWESDYLINTHNGLKSQKLQPINVENYPSIKVFLDKFLPEILNRSDQGNTFYNLRNCAYLEEFTKAKIIWKRIGSKLRFTYSDEEIYCLDSTCIATGEKVKYLTAMLNSKLCNYQLFESAPKTGMGDLIISVQALEPLLVCYPDDSVQESIEILLDEIIRLKKLNQETLNLEREIDLIVYKMHDFTYEEIKVIDPNFWLTEEEYNG